MSTPSTRAILVTRPQPAADEFAAKLRREGFVVHVAPMLDYEDIEAEIPSLAGYQALVFTSMQAVTVFSKRYNDRSLPVFAVGESTARTAGQAGFAKVWSADGAVDDIAMLIRSKKDAQHLQSLLHPCGEDMAQDLGALLAQDGITVASIPVYKAVLAQDLPPVTEKALSAGDISTVTLFSARAAERFVQILRQKKLEEAAKNTDAICLSARIAQEARKIGWRAVRVAQAPRMESVMDLLRGTGTADGGENTALAAEPVLEAFGGIRPLANRLDITPSTVQGWKKRGVIPANRADAIYAAAAADGIDLDLIFSEGTGDMTDDTPGNAKQDDFHDRRQRPDRRQKHTSADRRGNIHAETYAGPDRRSGIDRRAYHERQAQRIRAEKMRFVNRTVVMGAFFLIAVLYIGAFLMAPEFSDMRKKAQDMQEIQARIDDMNARLLQMQQQRARIAQQQEEERRSIGQTLNDGIGQIEGAARMATQAVGAVASAGTDAAGSLAVEAASSDAAQNLQGLLNMLGYVDALKKAQDGGTAITQSLNTLKTALASAPRDADGLNKAVERAKNSDPMLKTLMQNVSAKDLGAAAMLLTLNEFRSNVSNQRPFAEDLLLMQKFAGNDPEMQKALQRLAPYAESGVLSTPALQQEFKSLASDIVMAKLQGKDVSMQQEILARVSKLVKVRKIDDIEGQSTDAVVARAQILLDKGDVKGALRELQTLEGASASAANPFLTAAEGNLLAGDVTSLLTQNILESVSDQTGFSLAGLFRDALPGQRGGTIVPYMSPALQKGER